MTVWFVCVCVYRQLLDAARPNIRALQTFLRRNEPPHSSPIRSRLRTNPTGAPSHLPASRTDGHNHNHNHNQQVFLAHSRVPADSRHQPRPPSTPPPRYIQMNDAGCVTPCPVAPASDRFLCAACDEQLKSHFRVVANFLKRYATPSGRSLGVLAESIVQPIDITTPDVSTRVMNYVLGCNYDRCAVRVTLSSAPWHRILSYIADVLMS